MSVAVCRSTEIDRCCRLPCACREDAAVQSWPCAHVRTRTASVTGDGVTFVLCRQQSARHVAHRAAAVRPAKLPPSAVCKVGGPGLVAEQSRPGAPPRDAMIDQADDEDRAHGRSGCS
jgi:hypothetical protein